MDFIQHKGCARDLIILALLALVAAGVFTWWKLSGEKPSSTNVAISPPSVEISEEESLRLARKMSPADALARAETAYKESRYDEAATFSKAVLAKSPDQSRAETLLGQSYFMHGLRLAVLVP